MDDRPWTIINGQWFIIGFSPVQGTQLANLFHKQGGLAGKASAFRGAGPNQLDAFGLDAHSFEHASKQEETSQCLVILFHVMAFARMATCDHDAICAAGESTQDKGWVEATGAHHADE